MRLDLSKLVLAGLVIVSACQEQADTREVGSPQEAVVEWLAAVDRSDYEAAAEMAPPSVGPASRQELARSLAARLEGSRRDDSTPFAMSDIESSKANAVVRLRRGHGTVSVTLALELHDRTWHVMPAEPVDSEAQPPGAPQPSQPPGEAAPGEAAPQAD